MLILLGKIQEIIEKQFQVQIVDCVQIYSGNSRVLKLKYGEGKYLIAKIYPHSENDLRDRLRVEFGALSFLWEHGIRTIPQPLFADPTSGFAVYEFIRGERSDSNMINRQDIDKAVVFLEKLALLGMEEGNCSLSAASEACFSGQCYLKSIENRLGILGNLDEEGLVHREAKDFLRQDFVPLFITAKEWFRCLFSEANISLDMELTPFQRTLSPSDFGFHNAIRRTDGCLVFVDFEYFGWDDPAKMIVDFLHHPAMSITLDLKELFRERMLSVFSRDSTLTRRVQALYPILGLKWCLIMLNEFLPGPLARRKAANASLVIENVLQIQLTKARRKFEEIKPIILL
jgi:hypothetical protein